MKPYQHAIALLLTASAIAPLQAMAAGDDGTSANIKADTSATTGTTSSSSDIASHKKNRNEVAGTSGKAMNTDPSGRYKNRRTDDTQANGTTEESKNTSGTNSSEVSHKRNRNETAGLSGKQLNTDPSGRYKDRRTSDTDDTSDK